MPIVLLFATRLGPGNLFEFGFLGIFDPLVAAMHLSVRLGFSARTVLNQRVSDPPLVSLRRQGVASAKGAGMAIGASEQAVLEPVEPGGRRRRRLWPWLVAAVVIALAVAGVAVMTASPRLTPGSFYTATPTAKVANDGLADTRYVIDGTSGGVLHVSVRNPSRFPVTILGLATTPRTPSAIRHVYFDADPYGPGVHGPTPAHVVTRVTLSHDQEAGVLVDVRFPDCVPYGKGSSAIYASIPVRVSRLGVTRTMQLPLALPLWVQAETDHEATGTCHG